jgi:hypothetical protein
MTRVLTDVVFVPSAEWPDIVFLSLTTMCPHSLMGFKPYDACADIVFVPSATWPDIVF